MKIERFSEQGVERHFLEDGQEQAKIIPRLYRWHDTENWLSMRPGAHYGRNNGLDAYFGELDDDYDDQAHGRGVSINDDFILIGYFKNRRLSAGNYIFIHDDGQFDVGER